MGLSGEEIARIRRAYLVAGQLSYERLAVQKVRGERKALLKFIEAWDKLDIEERAAVSFELARMVSPDGGEAGGCELSLSVVPHDLDVGLAAFRAAETGRGQSGNKVREPGFREAVREAAQIWVDRGNEWRRSNIFRETSRYEANPMLNFVMEAVIAALPSEAIARATLGNPPDREELMRAVDTQLRGSGNAG
jgi:hypothetical protein